MKLYDHLRRVQNAKIRMCQSVALDVPFISCCVTQPILNLVQNVVLPDVGHRLFTAQHHGCMYNISI
jgi:hypothetical protein